VSHDAPTVDPTPVHERRVLVVTRRAGAVVERDLPKTATPVRLVIGRALECDVRIDDPGISRTHVILVVGSGALARRRIAHRSHARGWS